LCHTASESEFNGWSSDMVPLQVDAFKMSEQRRFRQCTEL
jgi:recombination DNA repair RAD52 pathway protein